MALGVECRSETRRNCCRREAGNQQSCIEGVRRIPEIGKHARTQKSRRTGWLFKQAVYGGGLPVWYDCVLEACGLSREDIQEGGRDVNSLALATATIARVRNTKASTIHYRISTILFLSGVKRDDLIRLNRMSPDSIIRLQNKMNEQLEGRVKIWKGIIEENHGALKLAKKWKGNRAPKRNLM